MYTKAKIFNLALGALLLTREITNADTDASNQAATMRIHWDTAFRTTLQDMDLDGTSTQKELELIEEDPTDLWSFSYKYPSDCVFFRRIQSALVTDNRTNHVPKRVAVKDGEKVIFTNQEDAIAEYLSKDVPLGLLSAPAGLCIAYRLAILSAPLIVGKGAKTLREEIDAKYKITKAEAQEHDRAENFVFIDEDVESEFVEARTS